MEVDCEGCAGCCIDWRALADGLDHERRGPYEPLDDTYNLVPLERDEIRAFVERGLGDTLRPRLWHAPEGPSVALDGGEVAAVGDRPVFFVGLRKPPKPVGPFDKDPTWLPTCVFLDPTTLQCRIHRDDLYPATCGTYPGENLLLDVETECERVERIQGGDRLLEATPPDDAEPLFGPEALGATVFSHPEPDRVAARISRFREDALTPADRAEFVAVAAASSPGTLAINDQRYEATLEAVLTAESWAGKAIEEWENVAAVGEPAPDPSMATEIEDRRGAPSTPGW